MVLIGLSRFTGMIASGRQADFFERYLKTYGLGLNYLTREHTVRKKGQSYV